MDLINNIDRLLGDDLRQTIRPNAKVSIAASCFSLYAYEALKEELEQIEHLRFIFSSPTFVTDRIPREKREFYIPKLTREMNLFGSPFEIKLRNELTQKAIARECAEWIRRKVQFRSNRTQGYMQGSLNVQNPSIDPTGNVHYFPLNGFTTVDLGYEQGDVMMNYNNKFTDPSQTQMFLMQFNQFWNDKERLEDVTQQVIEQITTVYNENSPEFIYYVILYNIFSSFLDDLNEDLMPNDATGFKDSVIWNKLYHFQRDAVIGAINKLEKYNGCILADSVGLGKTFTALGVIKYYELRNKSVLVLCPKKLNDNWQTYRQNVTNNILHADRLRYDVLYHTDLSRDRGQSNGIALDRINWGNYDLLVIDESHNFRNNAVHNKDKENRYQRLMRKVLQSGVKTKVLMLSATPVNNRFNDLKNQLALAYEGNVEEINKRLDTDRGIEVIFKRAQQAFNAWSKLVAHQRTTGRLLEMLDFDFFELLDSLTIARSRKHIQKYYNAAEIGRFPTRLTPISKQCALTERSDDQDYQELFMKLSHLNLGVYSPFRYILPSRIAKYEELYKTSAQGGKVSFKQSDRELSLVTLMRINLLKRLESSVHAFRLTTGKIIARLESTLTQIENYKQRKLEHTLTQFEPDQVNLDEDWQDELPEDAGAAQGDAIGGKIQISLSDMDVLSLEQDLLNDLHLLQDIQIVMRKITPPLDLKLNTLKAMIDEKIARPINAGNRKIIVFTAFSDTAEYLYEQLAPYALQHHRLHTAKITGSDENKNTMRVHNDLHTLLTCFSPRSKEKQLLMPHIQGEIDLLIATDCISEGQNLQDCDFLINYDIHWNPVRIIQRFGRIDRIGSTNEVIQLVNFWPNISLDEYIGLKERVEKRMVIMDMTATGEDDVLTNTSSDLEYRKQQLERLQSEVVDLEEMNAGVSITDLGLNDFRMDLANYVQREGDLDGTPLGIHAVVPADPEKGLHPGVVFVLRNVNNEVNLDNQNRLHPYYLVSIDREGTILTTHLEVKRTMDLLRAACKDQSSPIREVYEAFNRETTDGKKMDRYSQLLQEAIHSIIHVKEESDLDSLFRPGGTGFLVNQIQGLQDFELIAFLVIREV